MGQRSVQKKEYPIFQVRCFSSPGKDTRHNCLSALQQCQSWPRSCLLFCNSSFRAAVRLFRGSTPSFRTCWNITIFPLSSKLNYFCSRPKGCEARHRVAIIVPYRDREPHLRYFRLFETSGKMTEIQFFVAELSCWTYTGFSRGNRYKLYTLIDSEFSDEINNLKRWCTVCTWWNRMGRRRSTEPCSWMWAPLKPSNSRSSYFWSSGFVLLLKCPGLPVLHFPWCWLATGGRQKPVHLPNPTEAHVSVHW